MMSLAEMLRGKIFFFFRSEIDKEPLTRLSWTKKFELSRPACRTHSDQIHWQSEWKNQRSSQ